MTVEQDASSRDEEKRVDIKVTVDFEPYKEARGLLFRKNVSLQEFLNHLLCLSARSDGRLLAIMDELKVEKAMLQHSSMSSNRTNTRDLFNMLERASVLKSSGSGLK